MYKVITLIIDVIKALSRSKADLMLENLALRQFLANFKAKGRKPKMTDIDRFFWIALKQTWSKWIESLIIVKPETVIYWQKKT